MLFLQERALRPYLLVAQMQKADETVPWNETIKGLVDVDRTKFLNLLSRQLYKTHF